MAIPTIAKHWRGNLMPRWQFAFEFIRNEIKGTKHNLQALMDVSLSDSLTSDVDAVAALLLGAPIPTDRARRVDRTRFDPPAPQKKRLCKSSLLACSLRPHFSGDDYGGRVGRVSVSLVHWHRAPAVSKPPITSENEIS